MGSPAARHVDRRTMPGVVKQRIIARRGKQAKNVAKVAAARRLPTLVFYGMRDGQVRCLATPGRLTAHGAAGTGGMSSPRPAARRVVAGHSAPTATSRHARPRD